MWRRDGSGLWRETWPLPCVGRSLVDVKAVEEVLALATLVGRFGLAAIFVGAGIEGEAVAVTGGILAHHGLLPVWGVVIAAATGACLADQLWFWLARHYADAAWVRRIEHRPAFQRAVRIIEHHLIPFTLGFRFIYGMRTVTPIAISASHISSRTYVILNCVSAAFWGTAMVWLGYVFGKALDPWLHGLKSATMVIVGVGLICGAIAVFPKVKRRWRAWARRRAAANG